MESKNEIKISTQKVRRASVGWMIRRLSLRFEARLNKELGLLGLNVNQFAVIMTLLENGGLTQSQIGKRITMPGYSITRTMDVLEEKKLLKRHPDERSRRSYRIYLTERGQTMGPELFAIVKRVNERVLSPLDDDERQQLTGILDKLQHASLD